MSSLFDELSSDKRLCHNNLEGCIKKLSDELVIYKDANQSNTKEMYTKLITPAEYFQIKTLISKRASVPEYNTKIRGLLLTKLGLYKEIKLAVTSTDTVKDISNLSKLNEIVKLERPQQPLAALNSTPHQPPVAVLKPQQPSVAVLKPQEPHVVTLKAKEAEAELIDISYSKEAKTLKPTSSSIKI